LEGIQTARSVFGVSGRTFGWADVVCATKAWGRWADCEQAARAAQSAFDTAQRGGVPLDGPEFDAEENRFRRSRRLLAADELVSWLARRDVEVGAWRDYIRGEVLRRRSSGEPPADSDAGTAVWVQAMCSGTLDEVARRLAGCVATAQAVGRLDEIADPLTDSEVGELDRVFIEFCDRSATVDAIEREVDRRRLDWTMLELRFQAGADYDVMREAALCIREDGLGFEEVAAGAGMEVHRRRMALDGVPAELQPHLLGARVGELLGPLTVGSEYWLIDVLDKRVPSIDDPDVRALARDAVVSRAVEAEAVDRVRWDEPV
jgi:hypothetical protein